MRKGLFSLLAAALILTAVYGLLRLRERAAGAPHRPFAAMDTAAVTGLRVAYGPDSMRLIRSADGWVVEEDGFPADTARLARVLGNLRNLQARERVSRDTAASRLRDYGLDETGARRVAWTLADGSDHGVLLGKVSGIDYGSTFWKRAGAEESYRTPGTFAYEVSARARDWKDTNLFVPFAPRDVRSVSVGWTEEGGATHAWTLARAGDTAFVLRAPGLPPEGVRAARAAATLVFRQATRFKIDAFVAGPDTAAARAGLDHPVMTIHVRLRDGREPAVIAGNPVDGLYRYVRHPRHPDPVRVFLWRFEPFAKRAEDLAE